MFKKMTLLAAAVAALVAFAVPAAAQATPLVHDEEGSVVNHILAQSSNTVFTTNGGKLECTTVNLTVQLTTNNTATAHGSGAGSATGRPGISHTGPCASSSGLPLDFTSVTFSTIHLKAGGGSTAAFSYTLDITHPVLGAIHCVLDGSANVTFAGGDDEIQIAGSLVGTSVAPCFSEGTIAGDFTVTDTEGNGVLVG